MSSRKVLVPVLLALLALGVGGCPKQVELTPEEAGILARIQADPGLVEHGQTPLHLAAQKGHLKICEYLLAEGADVGAADKYGNTPLHLAASNAQVEVCRLLLRERADVNARDVNGETPLHHAAGFGLGPRKEVCRILLDAGADLEARDDDGKTPLQTAVECSHPDISDLLIERGAVE